ncbi:histone deacetylase complex subunit SAP130 isoform X3 [Xenopus tropicalis]|uniref:Histone deacetylase complex subunit SAP130 isoform X3 n=2 Tax=Xenopus tropicalis TaxID=8364 RepID=A0A8J0SWN5_XENTR|nr:histone deacetylase complex subunit SAP130 isoform X3 [Xenopus tropicalis]|eukprot:XP_012825456.1 PREDICTED: histone deacetylase complex subunit SAP130 isoform X3 [Xenopus tropicalis]
MGRAALWVNMSSQQFPRQATSMSIPQVSNSGATMGQNPQGQGDEIIRDMDVQSRDSIGAGTVLPSRDDKQEPVVVRPYPQVQMLASHHPLQPAPSLSMTAQPAHLTSAVPLSFSENILKTSKSTMPSRPIAPAPPSALSAVPKVSGQVTVTMESGLPQTSAIPVATISGQQGHPNSLHHIVAATNVQMSIIRSSAPGPPLHIGASHLPRGAAAAAVMSSSKVTTMLRPASAQIPSAVAAQSATQHIIHPPIQSRPPVTTTTSVTPAVVATVSATRAQSPVITTTPAHAAEPVLRPTLSIQQHPPPAAISIQRSAQARDAATTRITLPTHPALGAQKPQLHAMAQKTLFGTGNPVAAATVAPILATNTLPSVTTSGSAPHTQVSTSAIVTMTMPTHSSHATAVTASNIPVAKVVPQQITHTSPRIQSEYGTERGNLIPIPGHRASPNPMTMEARSENRQPVPVQLQYFLPTYPPSAYPLAAHTYTPITSSVSTIRQYPVSAQAPNSAITAQSVASTVHLNPMQLINMDTSHTRHIQGIQPAPVSAQGIQPSPFSAQGIQATPINTQGIQQTSINTQAIHPATSITNQGVQTSSVSSQQAPNEPKASVVLAEGATIVANPINSTFSATPAGTTVMQSHSQSPGISSSPAQGSSPRPSILRKKPATDGLSVRKSLIPPHPGDAVSPRQDSSLRSTSASPRPAGAKPKADLHVPVAPGVTGDPGAADQPNAAASLPSSHHPAAAVPSPPSQPASGPIPSSIHITPATIPALSAPPPLLSNAPSGAVIPEAKVKEEAEPMDISRPVSAVPPLPPNSISSPLTVLANNISIPAGELLPGASPRKKPRKQQHVISTEEGDMMETNSTDEERCHAVKPLTSRPEKRKSPPKEYIDEEGVRYVPVRPRPPITLLRHYRNPWKAAYHHFQRYSDVRVKEEKKLTLQEVANQKGITCRVQGWKTHLCAAQLLQLIKLEQDVFERLTVLQEGLIPKKKTATDDDLHRINELIQGNMQRCKLVMDQITESRDCMLKVLDHKDRVLKLLNKSGASRRLTKVKQKDKM